MPAPRIEEAAAVKAAENSAARRTADVPGASPYSGEAASPMREVDAAGQIVPSLMLQNALRFWWVLFAAIVLGGLVGLAASGVLPPVYEASAHFSAGIDYTSTGPLTQYEEDTAYNAVGAVVSSQAVMERVAERLAAEGIALSVDDLRKMIVLERRFDVWDLRIRGADPEQVRRIGEVWNEMGDQALHESYKHALQADLLRRHAASLEACLAQAAASEPAVGLCSRYRFQEIQADLRETGLALYAERTASGGMFAGLLLGPVEPVTFSKEPVQHNRGQLVLAGGMVGLLAGLALVESGLPLRWIKKRWIKKAR